MRRSDLQGAAAALSNTATHIRRTERRLRMLGWDQKAEELKAMAGRCQALSSQAWDQVREMPKGKKGRPSVSTVTEN